MGREQTLAALHVVATAAEEAPPREEAPAASDSDETDPASETSEQRLADDKLASFFLAADVSDRRVSFASSAGNSSGDAATPTRRSKQRHQVPDGLSAPRLRSGSRGQLPEGLPPELSF